MYTGEQYAAQAKSKKYDNIKYSDYDCQAFCELVLKDLGVRTSSGRAYNWRGSNDMFRNAVSWRGTIEECKAAFGCIPVGCWVFAVSHDGGEVGRGYNDDLGNAYHVGIYTGNNQTRDSTKGSKRDGVGYRPIKDWNYIGLAKCLDFPCISHNIKVEVSDLKSLESALETILNKVRGWLKE